MFYERVPDTVSAIQDMKRALGLGIEVNDDHSKLDNKTGTFCLSLGYTSYE